MRMIFMYVSIQTVPESAFEDDGTENKIKPSSWNIKKVFY